MRVDIYNYTDYCKYMHDYCLARKQREPFFTYRYVAQKIGFSSAGFLTQIIQGKSKLPVRLIEAFVELFEMTEKQAGYFELLVEFNHAKTHSQKRTIFESLRTYPRSIAKTVDARHYEYYDKWYYTAIRELLHFYPFDGQDYEALGKALVPAISIREARKAVALLLKLGFLRKDGNGRFVLADLFITTGKQVQSVAANNFVLSTIDLGKAALDRFGKTQRELAALTVSISQKGHAALMEKVAQFRHEVFQIAQNDSDVDRVLQVNIQAFPLTKIRSAKIVPNAEDITKMQGSVLESVDFPVMKKRKTL